MPYFDDNFIDDLADDLSKSSASFAAGASEGVAVLIRDYLTVFDIKNGNFVNNAKNIQLLNELQAKIETLLSKAEYYKELKATLKAGFEAINIGLAAAHLDANVLKISSLDEFAAWGLNRVLYDINGRNLGGVIYNSISKSIFDSIVLQKSLAAAYKATESAMAGKIQQAALTATRDTFFQYDRAVNKAVADKYRLNAFFYIGSAVAETRPQCKHFLANTAHGKRGVWLVSEIPTMLRYAETNGTGHIKGTTVETFLINAGGYNCRHRIFPTSIEPKKENG